MRRSGLFAPERKFPFLFLCLLFAGLDGCALFKPSVVPEVSQNEERWLAAIQRKGWALRGRIGVQGSDDSWHGSLRWRYRPGHDALKISGPLGQGGVVVEVWPDRIRLTRHDGQVQESNHPEVLLRRLLGVAVPLGKLHFWVLGMPAPGPARLQYGPGRRLSVLSQAGWRIEYPRYRRVDSGVLPAKLIMNGPGGVRVKLIIDRWETGVESRSA